MHEDPTRGNRVLWQVGGLTASAAVPAALGFFAARRLLNTGAYDEWWARALEGGMSLNSALFYLMMISIITRKKGG